MSGTDRVSVCEVVSRADLVGLLDELTERAVSHGRGRRWQCPFPDHADEHPSVSMFTDQRGHERWRCWSGDGHHGDAVDLVMAARQLSRGEAVRWLTERTVNVAEPRAPRRSTSRAPAARLDGAVVTYVQRCQEVFWSRRGLPVLRWLRERGLSDDVLRLNRIGADLGRMVVRRRRGLPSPNGLAATFPALDRAGTVVYVQTRALEPGDGPKYSNPTATMGPNPRVSWVRPPVLRYPDWLLVCEGIPDALIAVQAGFSTVAVMGTQVADASVAAQIAHAASERSPAERPMVVSVIVDADVPGRKAGCRLADLLVNRGVPATIVEPPDGQDLTVWAQDNPRWPDAVMGRRPHDVVRAELWAALRSRPVQAELASRLEAELDRANPTKREVRRSNDCGRDRAVSAHWCRPTVPALVCGADLGW